MLISTPVDALARFGHALSDPTRAQVMLTLRDGPAYPADLADRFGVTRQSISNHLTCLRGCGLVVAVPEGRRTRYELTDPRLAHALADLLALVLVVDPQCCGGVGSEEGTSPDCGELPTVVPGAADGVVPA
ncbi:ArsR/SmtB family transcription factor [Auraticoccus monumenti]|uniref:DNA-binding transcriptional regulator, ArsR family n=1 Tax=Auraticoccus monumenti TaxID=675864 RepID=A0A1G6ZXP6_9ACTN|nr:metalloregulator ArsR/SmtB family transcription factor [Auraticoccus monumenti]SDE07329.1 DNA-binding transcriptional regulator, ArsR family [Auraticoccus monumenti]